MRISDWSSDVCSSDLQSNLKHHTVFQGVGDMAGGRHWGSALSVGLRKEMVVLLAGGILAHTIFDRVYCELIYVRHLGVRRWLVTCTRSAECRVAKECVSQCRFRWSPFL